MPSVFCLGAKLFIIIREHNPVTLAVVVRAHLFLLFKNLTSAPTGTAVKGVSPESQTLSRYRSSFLDPVKLRLMGYFDLSVVSRHEYSV
ncbi:hypothetical protein FKM82_003376 [Ascaphus truei]